MSVSLFLIAFIKEGGRCKTEKMAIGLGKARISNGRGRADLTCRNTILSASRITTPRRGRFSREVLTSPKVVFARRSCLVADAYCGKFYLAEDRFVPFALSSYIVADVFCAKFLS